MEPTDIGERGALMLDERIRFSEARFGKADHDDVAHHAEAVCNALRDETGLNVVLYEDDEGNFSFHVEA